jgi:hypothetical protein
MSTSEPIIRPENIHQLDLLGVPVEIVFTGEGVVGKGTGEDPAIVQARAAAEQESQR